MTAVSEHKIPEQVAHFDHKGNQWMVAGYIANSAHPQLLTWFACAWSTSNGEGQAQWGLPLWGSAVRGMGSS